MPEGMVTDGFPRDRHGNVVGNILEVPERDLPSFGPRVDLSSDAWCRPDVVVIGAGYTGVSAALHLAELGRATGTPRRVLLVDAGRVGGGPSGKSAGHVCGLQASDEAVVHLCGEGLGQRLLQAASEASDLVRELVARYAIPCDLRDGYVLVSDEGRQTVSRGGHAFGVAPYPYLLGLAFAARRAGVEFLEHSPVTRIEEEHGSVRLAINSQEVTAKAIVAAGGHGMAERIQFLARLRQQTTELRVSTLVTEPLAPEVLASIMSFREGERLPFSTGNADVAYGSFDQRNRLIFGAYATAFRDPPLRSIFNRLLEILPGLERKHREVTRAPLRWRALVTAEQLCFTRTALPNVGACGISGRVLFGHALGGHGLALGTLLGRALAEKAWSKITGTGNHNLFDTFAAVRQSWLPSWRPARQIAGVIGLRLHTS